MVRREGVGAGAEWDAKADASGSMDERNPHAPNTSIGGFLRFIRLVVAGSQPTLHIRTSVPVPLPFWVLFRLLTPYIRFFRFFHCSVMNDFFNAFRRVPTSGVSKGRCWLPYFPYFHYVIPLCMQMKWSEWSNFQRTPFTLLSIVAHLHVTNPTFHAILIGWLSDRLLTRARHQRPIALN